MYDAADSAHLRELLAEGRLSTSWIPPGQVRETRAILELYKDLRDEHTGPGGYFGWNLDALDDCLCGRFGAQTPFRLVWHHSAVAREHLVAGYAR